MKKNTYKSAIFIIAPPVSGKGTQAVLLSKKLGFYHFMTSAVAKKYIATYKEDARNLRQYELYKHGGLFEPRWAFQVVKFKTKEVLNNFPGIIYDGSPRTLFEARKLYAFLENLVGNENIKIIEIKVSEQELKTRLAKRLICDKISSHVFISSDEFKENADCPEKDGGILKKRDLDSPELFNTRIEEYKKRTVPGLEFLKQKHSVIEINGEQSIEKVFEEILQKLNITATPIMA